MKREPQEVRALVSEYEKRMSEASVPLWMDAPDLLDILDHYEQNNKYYEAEQCMRLAMRLHPNDPEILIRRAYRYKNEGRWNEADAVVSQIDDKENPDVQFYYAERALSRMRFEEADSIYEKVLQSEKDLDSRLLAEENEQPLGVNDILIEIGELFLDYGHPDLAKKYLERIPESAPEYPRAVLLSAEALSRHGQYIEARAQAEKILDENPYDLDTWLFAAEMNHELKDFDKCTEAADYALAIEPQNEKALRFKAVAALGLEHWDEVIDLYQNTYSRLYPNDYTMALSVGEILINRKKFARARTVLETASQNCPNEHPDKMRIVNDIALTHAAEGNMSAAHAALLATGTMGIGYNEILLRTAELAFSYRQTEYGIHAVQHYGERFGYDAEARRRIASSLCENDLFVPYPAYHFWNALFTADDEQSQTAAPYIAYAARRIGNGERYIHWLRVALRTDPTTTQQIFTQVYPDTPQEEWLSRAQSEFPHH